MKQLRAASYELRGEKVNLVRTIFERWAARFGRPMASFTMDIASLKRGMAINGRVGSGNEGPTLNEQGCVGAFG